MSECRGGRLSLVLLMLALVAGCAGLPREGPVQQGGDRSFVAPGAEEPAVRRLAPPPRDGAEPEEIVRGFLLASAPAEDDAATARRYLTSAAAPRWRPEAGVAVLQGYPELTASGSEVRMVGRQVGAIDERDGYRVVDPTRTASVTFGLQRERGQWRIASLPDGLYLPRYEVDRVYRSLNAYYLTARQDRLVPEPIVLPATSGLATALVERLLGGPGPLFSPVVTNAVPVGAVVRDGSVPIRGGVAEVDLRVPAVPASLDREALAAQVGFTLRQVPGVTAVRLSLNGSAVDLPDVGSPQPVTSWARFDPDGFLPADPSVYATVSGRLGTLNDDGFTPLPGGAGARRPSYRTPAVSLDQETVAAVSVDGKQLSTGRIGQAEPLGARLRGNGLSAPSFDESGTLWVLEVGGSDGPETPLLWAMPPGERPLAVGLPDLDGGRVRAAYVARNGLHLVLVNRRGGRDELWTAALLRADRAGGSVQVSAARRIAPQLRTVRDVTWRDARTLAVLAAESRSVLQPYLVSLDGFSSEALSPVPAEALTLTASGGSPLLVGAAERRVFQASGRTWQPLRARAVDPAYPG